MTPTLHTLFSFLSLHFRTLTASPPNPTPPNRYYNPNLLPCPPLPAAPSRDHIIPAYQLYPQDADWDALSCRVWIGAVWNATAVRYDPYTHTVETILSFPGISLTGSAHVSAAVWDPYNSDPHPGAGASRRDWVSVLANSAQPWLLDDLGGDVSGERELIKWDVGKQAAVWRVGIESVTKGRYGGFQDVEHDRWGRTYIMGTYPGTILRVDRDGSGLTEWSVPEPLPPTRQKGWSGVAVVRETGGETMLAVDGDGRIYRFDLREEKGTAVHVPMWPEVLYNDTDAIYLPPMYGGRVLLVASVYTGIQVLRSEDQQWKTADYLGTVPIPSGELYEGAFAVSSVQMGSSSVFMVLFYSSDVQPGALAGNKTEFPFRDITDDINALLWNESRRGRS